MSIRNKLHKKPINGEQAAPEEPLVTPPNEPDTPPLSPSIEENPFGDSGEELTAVSLGAETLSTDPDKLPIIANHNSTRAFAAISAKADWLRKIGDVNGSDTRTSIRDNLLKFGISQAGDSNRVKQLFEMLKAAYSFEQQKELSTGERVMGKK